MHDDGRHDLTPTLEPLEPRDMPSPLTPMPKPSDPTVPVPPTQPPKDPVPPPEPSPGPYPGPNQPIPPQPPIEGGPVGPA